MVKKEKIISTKILLNPTKIIHFKIYLKKHVNDFQKLLEKLFRFLSFNMFLIFFIFVL